MMGNGTTTSIMVKVLNSGIGVKSYIKATSSKVKKLVRVHLHTKEINMRVILLMVNSTAKVSITLLKQERPTWANLQIITCMETEEWSGQMDIIM